MSIDRDALAERMKKALGVQQLSPHFVRLLDWDPEYLEAYCKFIVEASEVRPGGSLPRKYREMIALAVCAAFNNKSGTAVHIRAALANGATPREVLEALQCAVAPGGGVPAVLYGSEVLEQVLAELGRKFE